MARRPGCSPCFPAAAEVAHRVFVYGSLMRGLEHHDQIQRAGTAQSCATEAGYYLALQGRYPALVRGGVGRVVGEVYSVSLAELQRLDDFEGCPSLYQRQRLVLEDGSEAWGYLISEEQAADLPRIPSGCWRSASETGGAAP